MKSPNQPLVNIYPGKLVSADDMNSSFDWSEIILSDVSAALQRPDGYGLLAVPDLQLGLTLSGTTLQIHSIAALMPSGRLVIQHPVQSPELSLQIPSELAQTTYFIYLLATSKRQPWNLPDNRAYSIHASHRVPVYELHLKESLDSPEQYPDTLPIGRIVFFNGTYKLDETFQPPCTHMKGSNYTWNLLLGSKDLWMRLLKNTNKIITQTTGVPYDAPLGDLNRFAGWVWQYMVAQKSSVQYLREKSHPADLFLAWAGLASLFSEYIVNVAQRAGEMLQIMEWYAQGRAGYVFNQQEAVLSAQNLANMQYDHIRFSANFSELTNFMNRVCMAWIFLGETDKISWMINQNSHKLS